MEPLLEATNAAVGSAVSKTFVYPLDLIKTRMATSGKSFKETVEDLQSKDGGGLYRGIGPKMFKSATGKFFYFYIYNTLSTLRMASSGEKSLDTISNLVIGYFSEVFELPIIMPLEAIVSRVQASKDSSALEVTKEMYEEGGLSKFYVSLDAYILGAMQPAIQMSVFDQLRPLLVGKNNTDLTAFQAFSLGTLASSIAVTATYPMDMCRTVSQASKGESENKSIIDALKQVLKSEGFAGLFKGLSAQLFQSVLSSAIMLMVKEKLNTVTRKILVALFTALGLLKKKKAAIA